MQCKFRNCGHDSEPGNVEPKVAGRFLRVVEIGLTFLRGLFGEGERRVISAAPDGDRGRMVVGSGSEIGNEEIVIVDKGQQQDRNSTTTRYHHQQ